MEKVEQKATADTEKVEVVYVVRPCNYTLALLVLQERFQSMEFLIKAWYVFRKHK